MLRSKTNQWGHAGTTEYALERLVIVRPGRKVFLPLSLARVAPVSGLLVTFQWLFSQSHPRKTEGKTKITIRRKQVHKVKTLYRQIVGSLVLLSFESKFKAFRHGIC
nr:unnamed protein product [Brassica rapa]